MRQGWDYTVGGKSTNNHNVASVFGRSELIGDHTHSPALVYPTLANGVLLTAGGVWVLGAITEIIPAATVVQDFDIHWIIIEAISANARYELVLYYGAGDVECGRVRFSRVAATEAENGLPITTGTAARLPIPANSRIRAALASSTGATTATISLGYHTYP